MKLDVVFQVVLLKICDIVVATLVNSLVFGGGVGYGA